ncbi:MAG: DUF853 family protein [Bacteroidetes bacterium]|nr:DUF853 family protein [Bacteroidota bacterium]
MTDQSAFKATIDAGYAFQGDSFPLGCAMLEGKPLKGTWVRLPLQTLNRHGLVAGATGTGKTKTLQVLAEGLSDASVPVLMMDIKGDLSGMAAAGTVSDRVQSRVDLTGIPWQPAAYPVELLSLSHEPGVRLRSTIIEFGPILLSKILGLNETQEGIVSLIFKYCDDQQMPILDLKDFIKVLQFVGNEGRKELEGQYGKISTATTGTILRKVVELQQQGADSFFGELSFDVEDLMRIAPDGRGVIHMLRLSDMQNRPKLFSTFMLGLLAELYATLPEEGDLDRPKLVLFIDEAHLVFQEATAALLQQMETVIKLIRSKGVGIFFCTQNPQDIPAPVLSQLGLKVQHALRAFTAADRKAIRTAAENYPESGYYQVDALMTQLGIGEALVTMLNEQGIPTPLVHTCLRPPSSRMGTLSNEEILSLVASSPLVSKYDRALDIHSAYEMLSEKLQQRANSSDDPERTLRSGGSTRKEPTTLENILESPVARQVGRTAASILTRSLLGALGFTSRPRKRGSSLF